jgi:precorrin-6B methylase 2
MQKLTSTPLLWVSALLLNIFLTLVMSSIGTLAAHAAPVFPSHVFSPNVAPIEAPYQQRIVHNPDGIGKVYMGREIAEIMGHTGAAWLERPSRLWEEQPQQLIIALDLQPTDRVADIGAGTGYFSFRIAAVVPEGKVWAVDVQPEMQEVINFWKQEQAIANVETILASPDDPHLPPGLDLVLMVDAYHEFEYPYEVMTAIVDALKPAGRVVLAEYRGENPFIAIKALHKMTQRQVRREMEAVGLRWVKTDSSLPQQHLMFFEKLPEG